MAEPLPEAARIGQEAFELATELFPLCRSITGDPVRRTLEVLGRYVPLQVHEVPTGTQVLDWSVPKEWNIRGAYLLGPDGQRVLDFAEHNLHVVNYSAPFRGRLSLEALRPHLHSLPERPDAIPYRTTYYREDWGFCLTHRKLEALVPGEYEVCIDSSLEPGHLTYAEAVLPGESPEEILISAHVCHPSLADDNLSGLCVATLLARELAKERRRLTLRFLFAPGTIGAITWLARNREQATRIRHGLTLTCLGDSHPFTYKRTLDGHHEIDLAVEQALTDSGIEHQLIDYFPYGYDERQYNSPGFRLPVGSLMRGRHGEFPEYHTSDDNLEFIRAERLAESYGVLKDCLLVLLHNERYLNLAPHGEPQLGARGLYGKLGGGNIAGQNLALLWVLCLSDGHHGLLEIARRSKLSFAAIRKAAELLKEASLLAPVDAGSPARVSG